eukprot:scaffold1913_cov60-Phaeocystis_antarctica.AAC.1
MVLVHMPKIDHEPALALVRHNESTRHEVEASSPAPRAGTKAAVALGRQPCALGGRERAHTMVERLRRPVLPLDTHALAQPAQHVTRRTNAAPRTKATAYPILQSGHTAVQLPGWLIARDSIHSSPGQSTLQ